MKKIFTITLLLLSILFISTGCDNSITNSNSLKGSGNVVDVDIKFTNFSEVEAGHAFKVDITKGDDYSVLFKVDDNIVKYLDISKEGNTLKIFLEDEKSYDNITLEAYVTLPIIESVNFSGAVSASINDFEFTHDLNVELSGASNLVSSINTRDVDFKLSGASRVIFSGSGESINANVSGASNLQLSNFTIIDADLNISGASSSTINISGMLSANVSGASSLYYYGSPTMENINITGASTIQRLY
jgi:Putative auto-transporter adhesin, head GIN domain